MLFKKNLLFAGLLSICALPLLALINSGTLSVSDLGLVTDAGSIFDRSFNQSAWEGILKVKPNSSESLDAIQPIRHNPSDLVNAYSVHAAGKKKYVVAPGFYHAAGIRDWNAEGYVDELNFILLDGEVKSKNVASVIFETAAAGFLAGFLTSWYLNARKALGEKGYEEPKIGMWGGGDFPGVTDFMVGIVYGVKEFNLQNSDKKIKFVEFATDSQYTDSGFESGKGTDKAQFLLREGAQALFPVSGPQVSDAITEIEKTSLHNQKVIGVDSDGTIKFPNQKQYFITSILKGLTDSIAGIYKKISDGKGPEYFKGLGETTVGTIANKLTSVANNVEDGAWAGIDKRQEYYDKSTTPVMIKLATDKVKGKTWQDALQAIKNL